MHKGVIIIAALIVGCVPQQQEITDNEAIETVEGFFTALDVENEDRNLIDQYITDDFIIYEAGKKMNKQEFKEFVSGSPITKSDWELSDFRVSKDNASAHVSLYNKGVFEMALDTLRLSRKVEWLESAYLVKKDDRLKIKFYFSDNVAVKIDTIR